MMHPTALTDDVVLRLVQPSDAAALADAYRRNREHLAPWDPARTEEFFTTGAQQADIVKQLANHRARSSLPLVLAEGDSIVGRVNLANIVHGALESATLGYWVDADHAGRGLISAAVSAVIDFARSDLGLHRIEAGTLVHNVASQRVLQKAGFEHYGLAPRLLQIAGRWQDHRLFQIILHD